MENPSSIKTKKTKSKSGRKGVARLTKLTQIDGGRKIHIEFDERGEPIDWKEGSTFRSFIGLVARQKISILKDRWDDVKESDRDEVWNTILNTYDMPKTQFIREKWLSYAAGRWKDFKTKLTNKYVFNENENENDQHANNDDDFEKPWEKYPYIDEETWMKFVESRHHPDFLEKSKVGKEKRKKNLYPPSLSRGGYALLENKMMEERQESKRQATGGDDGDVSPPSPINRGQAWKRARINKKGQFLTEEAREIAKKIDSLVEATAQGTFVPIGRKDILATALEKEEHPGRVRGVRRGVGIREYFGPPSPSCGSKGVPLQQVQMMIEEMEKKAEARVAQLEQDFLEKIMQMQSMMKAFSSMQMQSQALQSAMPLSTKSSCIPLPVEDPNQSKQGVPCILYVENLERRLVACGKVYNFATTMHHHMIRDYQVKVAVEEVMDANAPVPFPNEEVKTVGEAKQNFILWLRRLVHQVTIEELQHLKESFGSNPQHVTEPSVKAKQDGLRLLASAAIDMNNFVRLNES